ncbi:MAG: hypothetical protein WC211_03760 [Dehalococcoidia bacterium]
MTAPGDIVWVTVGIGAARGEMRYHSRADCHSSANRIPTVRAAAEGAGMTECHLCAKGGKVQTRYQSIKELRRRCAA